MKKDQFEKETVRNLQLEIACGDFKIAASQDDRILIEAENTEGGDYTCRIEGDALYVGYHVNPHLAKWDHTRIVLYLPQNMELFQIFIKNGAGRLMIQKEDLLCQEMDLEIGAGTMEVCSHVTTENLRVQVGAGNVELRNVTAKRMKAKCGVGAFSMCGSIEGDIDVDCGMGKCDLKLNEKEDSYSYQIACALGSVSVNGNATGGFGSKQCWSNSGSKGVISLKCGLGQISLRTGI